MRWPALVALCTATALAAPAGGPLGPDDAAALVQAHNTLRAEVGVGPLAWDEGLARAAQQHVQTLAGACRLKHSQGSGQGENLAGWTQDTTPAHAVALWAREKPAYRGGGGPFREADLPAAHYTQVVWRGTAQVGCGRTTCQRGNATWTLLACRYSPAGNMLDENVYRP